MKGEDLKNYRRLKRLTRKEFGEEFGVSEHAVAKWEQDVNPIPKAVERLVCSPPQMAFSLEEFRRLQQHADEQNKTLEQVCIDLLRAGLSALPLILAIAGAILAILALWGEPGAWQSAVLWVLH